MAYTTLVAGTTITAAWGNASVRDQVVSPFASAAARSSAISSPVEGMVSHLNDTNCLGVYSGAAWSSIGPAHGALTVWTPVVVQGATPTLTVLAASWSRVGRMVRAQAILLITSAGTAANVVTVSLPVAMSVSWVSDYSILGGGLVADSSSAANGFHHGRLVGASTTTVKIGAGTESAQNQPPTFLGVAQFTSALANGDIVSIDAHYEAGADA